MRKQNDIESKFRIDSLARMRNTPRTSFAMVTWHMLLFENLIQAEDDWEHSRLSIGIGCSAFCRIYIDIEEDTFMSLALEPVGNWLLQKFIEANSPSGLMQCQRICLDHALFLTKHRYANFVVTKLIQESPPWFCLKLCVAFTGHILSLARHQRGSRILERIMEHSGPGQVDFFFAELVLHSSRIVGDKYGRYVIQHVLEHGPQRWRRLCLGVVLKSAKRVGHAGRYLRSVLSSTYKRSKDKHILRVLTPPAQYI